MDSEFSKGDKIYVYYGAYYAFNFYRHIFDSNEDIDDSKIVSIYKLNWSDKNSSKNMLLNHLIIPAGNSRTMNYPKKLGG